MGNACAHHDEEEVSDEETHRDVVLDGGDKHLGAFLAEFAASQEGQHCYSELQKTCECWDLAMAAVEHAEAAGFEGIDYEPENPYQWGEHTVELEDAMPGDIVQWTSYTENVTHDDGSYETKMAGFPNHTSVVAEAYDAETGVLACWGQNPDPVEHNEYHPASSTGGSYIIYRLACDDGN